MPDITVRGTFKPDPSYNHVEEVERSIKRMTSNRQNAISKPYLSMCIKSCLKVHQKVHSSNSKDA